MLPKNKTQEKNHKRMKLTIATKQEIIEKREKGMRVADLARAYNRTASTICTILKNKDNIKGVGASKGVTRMSMNRSPILDDVERLLLIWISEKQLRGDSVNENIICQKAKRIFADLVKGSPSSSKGEDEFKASRGWFEKFKRRTGFNMAGVHGEALITKAAEIFIEEFKKLVNTEGYLPQQVFNCDEASLFWRKMPKGTCITTEEKASTTDNSIEDRLTVLLCANASGDLKIKPLVVYHVETPRAFKKCNVQKSKLNVMWRFNSKTCVTRSIITDWINEVFGPSVKKYLLQMNLPLNVLLLMDSAPGHPPDLQNDISEDFKFIKILFLPSNVTSILQPISQCVISNFKKLYLKMAFEHCFEMTEKSKLSVREFWKDHFHIVSCLNLIAKAWGGVTKKTLTSAWKNLWLEAVVECDLEPTSEDSIVKDIMFLACVMGLEVNEFDIDKLVEEDDLELTAEELTKSKPFSSKSESSSVQKIDDTSSIKEMLSAWETVVSYVEKHHPNKQMVVRSTKLFNDNVLSYFQQILSQQYSTVKEH